ncbi:MAG: RNA polymerase sigma factor [Solirubrobacteraceae bacterium]
MGSKARQGNGGGEGERVERPITDEQLAVAIVELHARVMRDVAAIFKAKRLLVAADELREAVQYAFGEAAIRRPGHPKPRAWLTTVAYRYAVKERLRQRRELQAATVLALLGDQAVHHGQPVDVQLSVELLELLGAVAGLPEPQGQAIALQASGHTHAEIAARLGIAPQSVKTAIREGRGALRDRFRR